MLHSLLLFTPTITYYILFQHYVCFFNNKECIYVYFDKRNDRNYVFYYYNQHILKSFQQLEQQHIHPHSLFSPKTTYSIIGQYYVCNWMYLFVFYFLLLLQTTFWTVSKTTGTNNNNNYILYNHFKYLLIQLRILS